MSLCFLLDKENQSKHTADSHVKRKRIKAFILKLYRLCSVVMFVSNVSRMFSIGLTNVVGLVCNVSTATAVPIRQWVLLWCKPSPFVRQMSNTLLKIYILINKSLKTNEKNMFQKLLLFLSPCTAAAKCFQ